MNKVSGSEDFYPNLFCGHFVFIFWVRILGVEELNRCVGVNLTVSETAEPLFLNDCFIFDQQEMEKKVGYTLFLKPQRTVTHVNSTHIP